MTSDGPPRPAAGRPQGPAPLVRLTGRWSALGASDRALLFERTLSVEPSLTATVAALVAEVRAEGDAALHRFARRFDGVELQALEVPAHECRRALDELDPALRRGLERCARNLESVARASLPPPFELEVEPGLVVGRRADPLARVGVYAPGGRATYPSSVLMGCVPARAAGVGELVLCSPPGPSGRPSQVLLAAAALARVDRVFAVGGAGAVAAMAYGTQSVPRVDRIVGPGNAWVAEAKRQAAGDVGIDSPAGPSEILVVADDSADPGLIARELLAQAEHDADACVVALVTDAGLAARTLEALEALLPSQPRRETIEAALRARGAVLTLSSLDEAWPAVEAFAPEHLLLALRDADAALPRVRNAGTVFVGGCTSVAFGDYLTGANHVLPTAGTARRFSGLSVLDFVRWQTWQRVDERAAASLAVDATPLARSEGLHAHAEASAAWLDGTSAATGTTVPPSTSSTAREAASGPTERQDRPLRVRATLKALRRYLPKRPPCAVDLTDNTNLFGVPPAVARTLRELPESAVTRYPSPYAERLREALARENDVTPDNVVTGCGSDDVLDAALRALAEPGERIAYCPPTFSIVESFARANALVPAPCARTVDALASSGARLIYLGSPNNPTGESLPSGFLDDLLARSGAIVLLDEAYGDFAAEPSRAREAASHPRLVVVRTLSKAFGLAGLRVGYAVGRPDVVGELEKTRGPYKVGGVAELAALAALVEDREWVRAHADEVRALRQRFARALEERGLAPLASQANFLFVPIPEPARVADAMRERGISVRAFDGGVRITIGPWPLLERCLDALAASLHPSLPGASTAVSGGGR